MAITALATELKAAGRDVIALSQRIKDAFDPAGILEPGRSAFR